MKVTPRSWSYLLYGVNFLLYLSVIALWVSIPAEMTLNISATIFTLLLTVVVLILDRERFYHLYGSSQFRKFSSVVVSCFFILSLLGLLNYMAYKHPWQLDISKMAQNSLTQQTVKILQHLPGRLTFRVFARKKELIPIMGLLELYRLAKSQVDLETVDIEVRPDLVQKFDIIDPVTIVVEYAGRSEKITTLRELEITNAIIKVSRQQDPQVLFTTGHDEADLESKIATGASYLKNMLQKASYLIKQVPLATLEAIPESIKTVVIWGAKSGFLESELKVIDKFLQAGGNLLVALDPNLNHDKVQGLRQLLQKWGINIRNDLVIDQQSFINGSKGSVPLIEKFSAIHPITEGLKGSVFFPLASSVSSSLEGLGEKFFSLVKTSAFPSSWGESNPLEFVLGKVKFSDGDTKGPIALMGALQHQESSAKIVAFGNSTFISNTYSNFTKNYALFLRSLSWLVDDHRITSFNLPAIKDRPVFINSHQMGIIFYFTVLIVPLLLILAALYFYKRRLKL